jgi:hypothetical protein
MSEDKVGLALLGAPLLARKLPGDGVEGDDLVGRLVAEALEEPALRRALGVHRQLGDHARHRPHLRRNCRTFSSACAPVPTSHAMSTLGHNESLDRDLHLRAVEPAIPERKVDPIGRVLALAAAHHTDDRAWALVRLAACELSDSATTR